VEELGPVDVLDDADGRLRALLEGHEEYRLITETAYLALRACLQPRKICPGYCSFRKGRSAKNVQPVDYTAVVYWRIATALGG
jgi:hypothetical protein